VTDRPAPDTDPSPTATARVRSTTVEDVRSVLHGGSADAADGPVLVTGQGTSPGVGSGPLVTSVDGALDAFDRGDDPVLVAEQTSPSDEPAMRVAAAVVTARGGMASHAAVVARAWGLPAVCGAESVVVRPDGISAGDRFVPAGEWITVDGTTGEVRLGRVDGGGPAADLPRDLRDVLDHADRVADGRPEVWANADTGDDARLARRFGARGVGLCRTEHLFLGDRLPLLQDVLLHGGGDALAELEHRQRADLADLLEAMDGLPVAVRLLDPPMHEFLPRPGDPGASAELVALADAWREENPMLGVRGVRLGLLRPELYRLQIRALVAATADRRGAGGEPRPRVLVPMVTFVDEFVTVAAWVRELAGDLDVPVGAMVETPRAALVAGDLARVADFLSFGTNDLTQLLLGLSRDDVESRLLPAYRDRGIVGASPFERLDPVVVDVMRRAAAAARATRPGITVGVCGEQAADKSSVAMIREAGLSSVSCSPYRVPVARLAAGHAALGPA
jgi:pyruvate, orthophosphate dikinase